MRSVGSHHRLLAVSTLVIFMAAAGVPPLISAGDPKAITTSGNGYPTTSWAVGLVVPERARLGGGAEVRWEGVTNVTAAVTLPNVSLPDKIVYVVLSVMTSNGSILQAAAGIRPYDSEWLAYAWLIPSAELVPLTYQWIVNASGPAMAPGANVSISMFQASGAWNMKVSEGTRTGVTQSFPPGVGEALKAGDQEVFALESYSRSRATFQNMGNLTLKGLFLDGEKVSGGVYFYSDWDPSHTPLFAVGSSGANSPPFISLGRAKDGSFVWGYATVWTNPTNLPMTVAIIVAMVLGTVSVAGIVLWKTRKTPHPPKSP